jgi:hypothetical protein
LSPRREGKGAATAGDAVYDSLKTKSELAVFKKWIDEAIKRRR